MAPTFFSAGVPRSLPTFISLAPPAQDVSLAFPSESDFTLPSIYSLFIFRHNSVDTYEPEWQGRSSSNMAISFLAQTAVSSSVLLSWQLLTP